MVEEYKTLCCGVVVKKLQRK